MNIFKFAILLLNSSILLQAALNLSLKTWQLNDGEVTKPIEEAIKEYFEERTSLLSVGIHLEYYQQCQFYIQDYLTNVVKQTESMSFEIFIDHGGHGRKTKNVWYVDSHKAFCDLLPALEKDYVKAMGQYMVIMDTAQHLQTDQEMQQIFQTAFESNIVDIAIATYAGRSTFNLYTYDIFLPQQCRQVISRLYNVFRRGYFKSEELFPHKLRNFHKCPIEIYIRYDVPFFSYNLTKDQKEMDYYEGLEASIIRVMAKKLNFDIQLKETYGMGYGNAHDNGSVTGPFCMLRHREIDILIGYFHNPTRFRYFAASQPYLLTPQVMVIRKRNKLSIDGMWFIEPFRKSVWWMIFLTIALAMTLVSFLQYNLKSPRQFTMHITWLDMFGLSLGTYRFYDFLYFATKYGFLMWTFGFMIICASFGGQLYGAFHRRTVPSPITVSQLIKSNYTFFLKRFLTEDLIKDLQIPEQQIESHPYSADSIIYETILYGNQNIAVLTNYWPFLAHQAIHHLRGEFDMVPEALVTNQICAYMRPQSYLLEPFNNLLRSLKSGGLFEKWMMDAARRYGILDGIEIEVTSEPKPLSLAKMRKVFAGLVILYGLALAVFMGEVIVNKMVRKWN